MSRLPYLRREDLDDDGIAVWESVSATRGIGIVDSHERLVGPFNAFVHAPMIGARLASLGGALRFKMSVPRRLIELAIITVGAHWKAEFEWWAHARMARDNGVSHGVIDAIGEGTAPSFERDDERAVHDMARELVETGKISDETYARAQQIVGDQGMVELVSLCGYYTLISFILNAFTVPLPEGEQPQWPS